MSVSERYEVSGSIRGSKLSGGTLFSSCRVVEQRYRLSKGVTIDIDDIKEVS